MVLTMNGVNILIVEDERIIALDLKERLLRLGYGVIGIASRAETVLQFITDGHPDLVLMDIRLRGEVSGIEIATQIRSHFDLPVVFLTAHADAATLEAALATHPFGYIVKPFADHDLSTTLQVALANYQAEQRIRQALAKEKELNELKSQFVSIVSHEFRNPLSSILFTLEVLDRQEPEAISLAKHQLYVQRAKAAAKQMEQLINDILIVSELGQTQFQCHPTPMNVRWFCQELIEELETTVGVNHSLQFSVDERGSNDCSFYCFDTKLLRHILTNLLSNAVKYSPKNSLVELHLTCASEDVSFQIRDQGIGIPIADLAHLCEPFYRCTNVHEIPGTGLGLAIVKRCVDAHAGQIAIDSKVDLGTTITVTLKSTPEAE
jgi:signal transduction histidine kinase